MSWKCLHAAALASGLALLALPGCSGTASPSPAPPPVNCAEAVARAKDDPRLQIQGGSETAVNARESAKVHLYLAERAAASGDERECQRQLFFIYLR